MCQARLIMERQGGRNCSEGPFQPLPPLTPLSLASHTLTTTAPSEVPNARSVPSRLTSKQVQGCSETFLQDTRDSRRGGGAGAPAAASGPEGGAGARSEGAPLHRATWPPVAGVLSSVRRSPLPSRAKRTLEIWIRSMPARGQQG